MASHPPEAIHAANAARARLRRVKASPGAADRRVRARRAIRDERLPKKNSTAWIFFAKSRFGSGDLEGKPAPEAVKEMAQEWKAMSAAQKQVRLAPPNTRICVCRR